MTASTVEVYDTIYATQRIDRLPYNRYFLYLALISGMGLFFDLFDLENMSAAILPIRLQYHLTPTDASLTLYMAFLGMLVGALASGSLADKYGRRRLFLITLAIIAIGSFLTAISVNLVEIWVSRVITGFGIGGDMSVVWTYLTEMVPTKYRGRSMGIATIIAMAALPTVALLTTYFIAHYPVSGWRYVFLIGAIIAVGVLAVRELAPETPRYYLIHNDPRKAEEVLGKLERIVEKITGKELPPYDKSKQYVIKQYGVPLREIFGRDIVSVTALLSIAWVFILWGYFGYSAFLPTMLYERGYTVVHAIFYAAIGWIAGIFGPVIVAIVGERWDRKYWLAIYNAITAAAVLIQAAIPSGMIAAIVALTAIAYIGVQAVGGASYALFPERFPARIRGTATGFVNAVGRGAILAAFLVIGIALAGNVAAQLTFIGISFIAAIITLLLLPGKSSGRPLEEIAK
jgi:putative MFS transporter